MLDWLKVGLNVGVNVGFNVGLNVGLKVGLNAGFKVGLNVGECWSWVWVIDPKFSHAWRTIRGTGALDPQAYKLLQTILI